MRIFLIGGGHDAAEAHEPFVRAAGAGPVVVYVLDSGPDTDLARWADTLTAAGVATHRFVVVSPARPPQPADLDGAGGVYVAGGLTPGYRAALVGGGTSWLDAARAAGLPYAGFSAGASIAAAQAVVGGSRAVVRGRTIEVCDPDFGEGLDPVTVLPGLGLVPFPVEPHAAQWGTLNRLVHALPLAGATEGWAVDENTALEVADGALTVHGAGAATRVRLVDGRIELSVSVAGDRVEG